MWHKIKNLVLNSIKKINDSYEFKPLLSEIEEAPVSPLGRFTFWTVISLIIITTLWLFIGKVDIVVNARGIVIPDGEAKIIQPLETGVIKQILVKEGDFVKKGQMLIEIDSSTTDAQLDNATKNLEQSKIEAQRLNAGGTGKLFNPTNENNREDIETQKRIYQQNLQALNSSINAKQQEINQINRQIESSLAQKRDYQSQLINAKDREKRLKTPTKTPILIKAKVLNRDIGFIQPDMPVSIKIDTYDFQKYGILRGKVKSISQNSIEDEQLGPIYEIYIKPEQDTLHYSLT